MFIRRQQLWAAPQPTLLEFVQFTERLYQLLRCAVAVGGFHDLLPMFKDQFATCLPLLAWLQFEFKEDASVGEPDRHPWARDGIGHGAVKIFVIVAGTQSSLLHIP